MDSAWSQRYGERHRLIRVADLPAGIAAPKKVRIYFRHDHYVLQWWDRGARSNLADRVNGDLVAAISRARWIEERLELRKSAGQGKRRLTHEELVQRFLDDLNLRANAGEIEVATVLRYGSALGHFLSFVQDPQVLRSYFCASAIDRQFALEFSAYLQSLAISPNGCANAQKRLMRGQTFVEAAWRAMLHWAADPERGNLLPDGFRVPALRKGARRPRQEQVGEPDITVGMAVRFIEACDAYQLRLFAPLILFGLRAKEPCFLFQEDVRDGWLQVRCRPELAYMTKGRRDKALPLPGCLQSLCEPRSPDACHGLLYVRRRLHAECTPLLHASLAQVIKEFETRCTKSSADAAQQLRLRNQLLKEAGALEYDQIEAEFRRIAKQLGWPANATIKDFRHLFSTSLENAGVPQHYRQYLMGHVAGRAPITVYTHVNKVAEQYHLAVRTELQPLVHAITARSAQL